MLTRHLSELRHARWPWSRLLPTPCAAARQSAG